MSVELPLHFNFQGQTYITAQLSDEQRFMIQCFTEANHALSEADRVVFKQSLIVNAISKTLETSLKGPDRDESPDAVPPAK